MLAESLRDRGVPGINRPCRNSFVVCRVVPLIAVIAVACMLGGAESPSPTASQVKAAFLYNFAKFVEWPADVLPESSTEMGLCILGEDPFGADLDDTIQGKSVNGRGIEIKRFRTLHALKGCHVLFISSSEWHRLPKILEDLKGESLLTVGEMTRFAKLGGIINFAMEENKVRFEINIDAAERARLRISSRLLKLAKVIRGGSVLERD
jgi:hypothetical protein